MYLKSLEIQGFKSFPDKTVLNFDGGITAIVGPNGSGKSNVSDAMRWVLGEQSTKTLRGGKMEDVIFKGTASRHPVGFAQVSLIVDNEDGTLPFDQSEVMVTRRYYRSGESEYYINRAAVRLRDIHELFMDTGLGRDGYSIIGQGRIDEILSVKSGDRREIFEEAAGISKYRHRKEEATRKLDVTEDNLLRINDKLAELELQVGPLKEQSEKAKKYLILRDELRQLEVNVWLDTLERLQETGAKVQSDYENICRQAEENQAALDELYRQGEQVAEELRDTDVSLEAGRAELSALEAEEAELLSQQAVVENTMGHNGDNISRIQQESVDRESQVESLTGQMEERDRRLKELEAELGALETQIDALLEEVRRRTQLSDDEGGRIAALRLERENRQEETSLLRARTSALVSLRETLDARQEALAGERTRLSGEQAEQQAAAEENQAGRREAQEQLESAQNVIKGYELRLGARRETAERLNQELSSLSAQAQAARERQKLLSEMEREFEGYSGAVRTVMRHRERKTLSGIHGPVSALLRTGDRYSVAIETALGPAMQNIVVDTEEDAKEAIKLLKQQNAGRATFLPMNTIRGRELSERGVEQEPGVEGVAEKLVEAEPRYAQILKNLLGRIVIVDNLDHGIRIARKYGHRFRIVTLDGQVMNAGGSMTGGSVSRSAGIFTRRNELRRVETLCRELEEKFTAVRAQREEARREVEKVSYELEVAQGQRRTAEDDLLRLESAGRYLAQQAEALKKSLAALQEEWEENEKRRRETREELSTGEETARRLREELDRLERELTELQEGHTGLEEERSKLSEEVSALRQRAAALAAERVSGEQALAQLRQLRTELSADQAERLRLIGEYEQKNNALAAEKERLDRRLESVRRQSGEKRQEIAARTERRMELEGRRTRADRESQDRNRDQLTIERERGRLEQQTQRAELERKQIIDRLWEHYELTHSDAQGLRTPVEDLGAAKKRIGELKSQIGKLGSPNLGAIEEYARVSERYEYLGGQRDDVEKARRELLEIIGEITDRMKEIFALEFQKINSSFGETFVEIFGGGGARLELEDENDILNCGIEIKVQLPGKRLETLSLLSGGERAFVAIALYFAILKVRPTPFCILDEIDAALDDVNVARFAAYLRKLFDRTQFIVITHRRGTMEEADMLYGVTMRRQGAEEGVSKLLALHLNDVEQELKLKLN